MTRFRSWLASPAPQWATTGRVVAIFAVPSVLAAIALVFSVSSFNSVQNERRDRIADTKKGSDRDQRIRNRVGRVERRLAPLCRRDAACRAALEAERRQAVRRERRQRRDGDTQAPDQRADRPPRQPANPPTVRQPDASGGDDPPMPPSASTPSTPPSSPVAPNTPAPVVRVDLPPVDLDGDQGLLPQLLPDLNLPPVDVPPVRVP